MLRLIYVDEQITGLATEVATHLIKRVNRDEFGFIIGHFRERAFANASFGQDSIIGDFLARLAAVYCH